MKFDFLKKYIHNFGDGQKQSKHKFFHVDEHSIDSVRTALEIPNELIEFYTEIGHGFMFDSDNNYSINKFLDPIEFKKINLRENRCGDPKNHVLRDEQKTKTQ